MTYNTFLVVGVFSDQDGGTTGAEYLEKNFHQIYCVGDDVPYDKLQFGDGTRSH